MNISPLNSALLLMLSVAFFSFIVWRNSSPLLALIGLVSIGYYTLHLASWILEGLSNRFQDSDSDATTIASLDPDESDDTDSV